MPSLRVDKMLKNTEIQALISAIGAGVGELVARSMASLLRRGSDHTGVLEIGQPWISAQPAKYGVNAVRLHKYADGPGWAGIQGDSSFLEFEPEALDRLDGGHPAQATAGGAVGRDRAAGGAIADAVLESYPAAQRRDCAGLVLDVYRTMGIALPRNETSPVMAAFWDGAEPL